MILLTIASICLAIFTGTLTHRSTQRIVNHIQHIKDLEKAIRKDMNEISDATESLRIEVERLTKIVATQMSRNQEMSNAR